MKVFFTARARRRAALVAQWWRANRPAAPTLFEEELESATRRLEHLVVPGIVYSTVRGRPVCRVLLTQSAQHVYYSVDAQAKRVIVHTNWGARRGRGPAL